MTVRHTAAQFQSRRSEMGSPMPRRFSKTAWWRFARDRRRRYLAQLSGPPSHGQAAMVETLVRLEWAALKHEADGSLAADRVALDSRRLYQRVLADFERSLPKSPPPARPPSLAEHLGKVAARREGAA
jgi:hypothetical protein